MEYLQESDDSEDEEPAAKKSRLELINKSDNGETLRSIMNCISILENLKKQNDVKEIMKAIEKDKKFELPSACRQRRTMNADGANDVSEVYSAPRITKMARSMGLDAGWALDLIETDPDDNKPWDFS